MKNTGITRKIDDMGRIVLPMELRQNLGIAEGTPLEISVDGSNIVLSPVARPLTLEELEVRIGKPIFCKDKKTGMGIWDIVENAFADSVYGTDDECYASCEFDFYDKEV